MGSRRSRVVPWWLEDRVGREGVYGDRGALMRGVEVVVVRAVWWLTMTFGVGMWQWSAVLGSSLATHAVASPALGAVSWGTRMLTAHASGAGGLRSGRCG